MQNEEIRTRCLYASPLRAVAIVFAIPIYLAYRQTKPKPGSKPLQRQEHTPQISAFLLHYQERADREGVYAGAVEAADGGTGVGDERFSEKVEAGVDENWGRGGFAKFVKQLPEKRIGLFFDSVDTDSRAIKGEAFETRDGIFQIAQ